MVVKFTPLAHGWCGGGKLRHKPMMRAPIAKARDTKRIMKRVLTLWSVVILSLCGVLALADDRAVPPLIKAVRMGVDASGQTRIVLDIDNAPKYDVLPIDGAERSLLLTVDDAAFATNLDLGTARGAIASVAAETSAVRLTLNTPALPVRTFVIDPSAKVPHYRLVVDLGAVRGGVFAEAAAEAIPQVIAGEPASEAPEETPTVEDTPVVVAELPTVTGPTAPPPSLKPVTEHAAEQPAQREPGSTVIVIDPGHGGFDPGAIGSSGLKEKTITLSAAVVLADILRERGYDVRLTREDDSFVELEERIEFARNQQADLFLSLHADANPVPHARGASVYTLSETRSSQMAQELTEHGDFRVFDVDMTEADGDIGTILFDLANTDTKNQSARLATALIAELKGVIPMVNNTHRKAGLKVLLSPDVPAVLFELAFLSNADDEANLSSVRWRNRAMAAVADGIDLYFSQTPGGRRAAAE